MADHTYLYKILDAAPPAHSEGPLPLSRLDQQDGFIHLSTAAQVAETLDRFFDRAIIVYLLKIRQKDLDGDLRYEGPGETKYPHLYDSKSGLHSGVISKVIRVDKETASWSTTRDVTHLED